MPQKNPDPYVRAKRLMDAVAATALIAMTLPLQGIIALLIFSVLGRPVLFKQERPGLNGEIFLLLKFRTMANVDELRGLKSDASRMTRLGSFLRATSLDELPTLINVVKGDMSLVGPRPLLVSYLPRYSPEEARRHLVRPGVTGLAQVNGRNTLRWEDKFRLDIQYVEQMSVKLDCFILWRTVQTVLRREGISAPGSSTMPEFEGPRDLGK